MAQSLTPNGLMTANRCGVALCAVAISTASWAETFQDPTRPPAAFYSPQSASIMSTTGPVLQSVLISPTRSVATINGLPYAVGEMLSDKTVVKITENEVVLRNGNEFQTLKLFPTIDTSGVFRKTMQKPSGIDRQN